MRRLGEARRRRTRLWPIAGLAALLSALSGCAAMREVNREWGEVWHGTTNLFDPTQGPVSSKAVEIDRSLQRQ
jgi:hypothetical protein